VNVVVLAVTVAAEPVERRIPSGDEVTELRLSVPEAGKRLLPLPVAVWHTAVGKRALKGIGKGDDVLVYGTLARRFYRSGWRARRSSGGGDRSSSMSTDPCHSIAMIAYGMRVNVSVD
jgi:hypothetical protein